MLPENGWILCVFISTVLLLIFCQDAVLFEEWRELLFIKIII